MPFYRDGKIKVYGNLDHGAFTLRNLRKMIRDLEDAKVPEGATLKFAGGEFRTPQITATWKDWESKSGIFDH